MNAAKVLSILEAAADPWIDPQVPWDQILADLIALNPEEPVTEAVSDAKVVALATKFDLDPDAIRSVAAFDPTDGKYLEWLLRQTHNGKLRLPEDGKRIHDQLAAYTKLKLKSTFSGEKDINRLDPGKLFDLLQANSEVKGKKELVRDLTAQGVTKVAEAGGFIVWKVTTPEAGAKLWRDTNWCVKDPSYFNRYKPPYFYFTKAEDNSAALLYHAKSRQLKTPNDNEIGFAEVQPMVAALQAAGLLLTRNQIIGTYVSDDPKKMGSGSEGYNRTIWTLSMLRMVSTDELAEIVREKAEAAAAAAAEKKAAADAKKAAAAKGGVHRDINPFTLAGFRLLKDAWVDNVAAAMTKDDFAQPIGNMAANLVKFSAQKPEVFTAMAETGSKYMYHWTYQINRALGRPEGAPIEAFEAVYANAAATMEKRSPLFYEGMEDYLRLASGKARREDLEPLLLQDVKAATGYFGHHKERFPGQVWPELKAALTAAGNLDLILKYLIYSEDQPWPEADALALSSKVDPGDQTEYIKDSRPNGIRWPEGEKVLLQAGDSNQVDDYYLKKIATWEVAKDGRVIQDTTRRKPWPEAEPVLLKNFKTAFNYWQGLHGREKWPRWPELEAVFLDKAASTNVINFEFTWYLWGTITNGDAWNEGLAWINQHPETIQSFRMLVDIAELQGKRWLEIEPYLKATGISWHRYREVFKLTPKEIRSVPAAR